MFTSGAMADSMSASGKITKCMGTEFYAGLTANDMKATIISTKKMDMALSSGKSHTLTSVI